VPVSFDPFSPAWRDDPYPKYRELRDHAPVHWSPEAGVFCVSRYEDVMGVLRSHDLFSSRAMMTQLMLGGEKKPPVTPRSLLFAARLLLAARVNPFKLPNVPSLIASDGQRHALLRAIVNRGFTPRQIAAWEARAREIVADCLASRRAGDFDVVRDLAVPLPVTLIAEMLGVEPERHRDFKRWSDTVIDNATGAGRADPFGPAVLDAFAEMATYVVRIARARRARPADDLISLLVSVGGGEGLSPLELVQFVTLLLVAGNETTTNLIGNACAALLDHPDQLARVGDDPSLVPALVEEAVRFDSPIQLVFREALADAEIAGVRIPAGSIVVPLIGSANRDERRFPDPDRFDVARNPRGGARGSAGGAQGSAAHLGFGFGKHFCLGASLARLEAKVALEALVPELLLRRRIEPRVPRIDSFLVRGPSRLPLSEAA
jgi:cytochrome P450